MPATAPDVPIMTRDEYLAFEADSETKHEFWPLSGDREGRGPVVEVGEAVMLAGAGLAHNQIVSNLTRELGNRLLGQDCRVLSSDLRVKAGTRYYYPDVVALCDTPKLTEDEVETLVNPALLVEVVAPSTSGRDRGKKLHRYTQIESLEEYWIVEQAETLVTRIVRSEEGWLLRFVRGKEVALESEALGVSIPLADVYALVEFPQTGQAV